MNNVWYTNPSIDYMKCGVRRIAELENSKDLISVLWSGADITYTCFAETARNIFIMVNHKKSFQRSIF